MLNINKIKEEEGRMREIAQAIASAINERRAYNKKIQTLRAALEPHKKERAFLLREGRVANLLKSIRDIPSPCGMRLDSETRVKFVFRSDMCNETCPCFDICAEIVGISAREAKPSNRKSRKSRKVVNGRQRISGGNIPIKKDFSQSKNGIITYTIGDNIFRLEYRPGDFEDYKRALKEVLPRKVALAQGITTGQYSGLTHRGTMARNVCPTR